MDGPSKKGQLSPAKAVVFTMVLLATITLLAEGLTRLVMPSESLDVSSEALPFWVLSNMSESNFIADRLLFWRVPASTHRLHTNSRGLRGPEFSIHKEDGVFRIVTLGDSCTWGFGVFPGLEYANQLQIQLNQTMIPVIFEVQNAGIPGFSSLQGLRYLESELLEYDPDLITLYFGRNDRRKLQEEGGYAPDHEVPVPSVWISRTQKVMNHLRIYQVLRKGVLKLRINQNGSAQPGHRGTSIRTGRKFRIEADEFEENFTRMIELAQSRNIRVYSITAPVFPTTIGHYNEIVRDVSFQKGVWVLDAEKEFLEHDGNGWLVDECHPNEQGHSWIANQLYTKILQDIRIQQPLSINTQ